MNWSIKRRSEARLINYDRRRNIVTRVEREIKDQRKKKKKVNVTRNYERQRRKNRTKMTKGIIERQREGKVKGRMLGNER